MDDENETLTVKVNDAFAEQSFTPQVVEDIYAKIKRCRCHLMTTIS